MAAQSFWQKLNLYMEAESSGPAAYFVEELLSLVLGWIPSVIGVMLRGFFYRALIGGRGFFMMESGVRVAGMRFMRIDDGVYIDHGVYLHGRPGGLIIGAGTRIMHNVVLHGYNFRGLPDSGISIGKNCVIGINAVITGQGRVTIEDDVIIAPGVLIMPVNHNFGDAAMPVREQGITGKGIRIESGSWIGAGAIILDGVRIGRGAVVAAGSVVNNDVPAMTLVAGNPTAVIRQWGENK